MSFENAKDKINSFTLAGRIIKIEEEVNKVKQGKFNNGVNLNPNVEVSSDTRSTYLFSKDAQGKLFINSPKLRDVTRPTPLSIYKFSSAALNGGIDSAIVKNGAMTTAVITESDGHDVVTVTGGDNTSYFTLGKQFTLDNYIIKVRVKINSLGTTPLLGIRNIWPGAGFSNSNGAQAYAYVNLTTGVLTVYNNNLVVKSQYNGWSGTAVAGDIIEFTFEYNLYKDNKVSVEKINSDTGQISSYYAFKYVYPDRLNPGGQFSDWSRGTITHSIYSVIMADGAYEVLDVSVDYLDAYKPKVLTVGDSMSVSAYIFEFQMLSKKLKDKQPFQVGNLGAGSTLLTGMLACIEQIFKIRPEYLAIFNYIDPVWNGNANPANAGYATWVANFNRYIAQIKGLGIKPIFVYPESWTFIADATACAFYETFLNDNYPNDIRIKVLTTETTWDGSSFHYSETTNGIIADKIIAALKADFAI